MHRKQNLHCLSTFYNRLPQGYAILTPHCFAISLFISYTVQLCTELLSKLLRNCANVINIIILRTDLKIKESFKYAI